MVKTFVVLGSKRQERMFRRNYLVLVWQDGRIVLLLLLSGKARI